VVRRVIRCDGINRAVAQAFDDRFDVILAA
jgi:hypothetical protein